MANEPGVGRFLGVHPPFVADDTHIAPKYDSVSEPEATGRPVEQTIGGVASARLDEAKNLKADLPCILTELYPPADDLLTAAPKFDKD